MKTPEERPNAGPPAYTTLSSAETLRDLVDRLKEGIYITGEDGTILDANPAFLEMFGFNSIAEMNDVRASDLLVDPAQRQKELEVLAKDGAVREFELQLRRPDGGVRTVLDTCHMVTDKATGQVVYYGILVDITQLKELQQQLHEQATRDALTGCHNRRCLATVAEEIDHTPRECSVAVIDIDHFKRYNDELGHKAGDLALVRTARFLQNQVRSEDLVCRIGGDEFLLLFLDADREEAEQIVGRLMARAKTHAPVPFSLGWTVRKRREKLEKCVARADENLISVRVEARSLKLPNADRRRR